jgi:hypothetical protein
MRVICIEDSIWKDGSEFDGTIAAHKGAIYHKMKRNFELQALSDLGKDYPEQAKKYLRYTLSNFLYPRYRKFILKYIFTGHF